jgi:metallo-beta-lactamase family protein
MEFKLSFLGAAQNVTGSRHMLEANGKRILVDCGLYQERQFRDRNWGPLPVPAAQIDAVLLTHAHLDHCGLLPKLVKDGFKGAIYCTSATAELAEIILLDAAKIQEEDTEFKNKRHRKEGRTDTPEVKPLYTVQDAEAVIPLFSQVEYRQALDLGNGLETTFYDAGHVLGSSIIRVKIRQGGQERIILFSGDIGRPNRPIVRDTTIFDSADYVLIESTYGNRLHKDVADIKTKIGEVVSSTVRRGGNVVVPSFALERSQELLYYVDKLLLEKAMPHIKIFLDSPMASKITTVFKKYPELFDGQLQEMVRNGDSPFSLADVRMAGTSNESKAINEIREPIMIIAGSGMCTGGRIKHHLANNIAKDRNTIMFIGYQAVGTLGRQLVEKAKEVRILGQVYPVKAQVVRINGFSAHADKDELVGWLKKLQSPPRKVFVVHGEMESAVSFGNYLRNQTGWQVMVPEYNQSALCD